MNLHGLWVTGLLEPERTDPLITSAPSQYTWAHLHRERTIVHRLIETTFKTPYDPGFMNASDSIPMYMDGAFAGGRWVHLDFEEQALLT
jgi:hypothetical protein